MSDNQNQNSINKNTLISESNSFITSNDIITPVVGTNKGEVAEIDNEFIDDLSIKETIKEIAYLALPTTFFFLCLFVQSTISLAFIGGIYDNVYMFDGIGVATLYINCTFFSIAVGIVSGVETLGANAFGIKNYYLLGLYLHRGRLMAYLFCAVMIIINVLFAERILTVFGLPEQTLYYAVRYTKIAVWFIVTDIQFSTNFRFINIVDKSHINLIVVMISIALHPLWCYIFIKLLDLDVVGAAISLVISQGICAILTSLYVHFYNPYPESYFWFNKECFVGWCEYIKFTIPSILLLCGEWWGFELQSFIALAIKDGEYDYSAHIFLCNLNGIIYSLSLGFSIACTIMVGKYIAEGKVNVTKKVIKVAFICGQSLMIIISIFYLIFGGKLFSLFTTDQKILDKGSEVIPIQALSINFDMSQAILSNSMRGLGKQLIASLVSIITYYIYGASLSCLLTLHLELGVVGIWIAIASGYAISTVVYGIMLLRFDYNEIRDDTKKRLDRDIAEVHIENRTHSHIEHNLHSEHSEQTKFGEENQEHQHKEVLLKA